MKAWRIRVATIALPLLLVPTGLSWAAAGERVTFESPSRPIRGRATTRTRR